MTTVDVAAELVLPRQVRAVAPREDELRQLERVRAELLREFAERLSAEEVERLLADSVDAFAGAPIRSFVPVLAQRQVRARLQESLARQG